VLRNKSFPYVRYHLIVFLVSIPLVSFTSRPICLALETYHVLEIHSQGLIFLVTPHFIAAAFTFGHAPQSLFMVLINPVIASFTYIYVSLIFERFTAYMHQFFPILCSLLFFASLILGHKCNNHSTSARDKDIVMGYNLQVQREVVCS